MSDQNPAQRRLVHEWYGALATIIGGFVVAIAVAAYVTFGMKSATQPTAQQTQVAAQQARTAELVKLGTEICGLELTNAKNFGVVPNYGELVRPGLPRATDVRGRYVCIAATSVSQYVMAADLLCKDLKDSRCVNLFSVTQGDGTVLYQRQG